MAFDDNPQVDLASIHDEKASLQLQLLFYRGAGFIARTQSKDMGCDFKVELIENSRATNWSFDIQLKSIEKPNFISGGQFLSFSIKTSRVGYLVRNAPIYGLLVIYDVGADVFYYDMVDKLYSRLMHERESETWKANDEVSVHVPCLNKLDKWALGAIHEKFLHRFMALRAMNADHGASYGLPNLKGGVAKSVITSVDDAVAELRKLGAVQLMESNLRRIYQLIKALPREKIVSDRELLLIVSLAYHQMGMVADSMFYIDRLRKRFDLKDGDSRMIDFITLKNRMWLGDIDRQTFVECAKGLLPGSNIFEEMTLRLNILNYELVGLHGGFFKLENRLVKEFEALEIQISNVIGEAQRQYLKTWNLENLSIIASHVRTESMLKKSVFEQYKVEMNKSLQEEHAQRNSMLFNMLHEGYRQVGKFALESNDFALLGSVTISSIRFWLNFEIDVIVFGDRGISREKAKLELDERIDIAQGIFPILLEYRLFKQAYTLKCMTLELLMVSREWYGFADRYDLEKIREELSGLESDLELAPFVSGLPAFMERKKAEGTHGLPSMPSVAGLTDMQVSTYASYILETGLYPNGKLENLFHEMKTLMDFHQDGASERFELFFIKPADVSLTYAVPHQFYIRNRKTGLTSLAGLDLENMLDSFDGL
ncbi:MAG: DUF4365 domain-containing protein [Proteobacteria bacterium]|nr:MAG: DUF4365 domain-containing protein [Pseudomonadota bacterium]